MSRALLKSKDPALDKAMDEVGHVYREVIPDMFMVLIHSIIGQQISTKAQEIIGEGACDGLVDYAPKTEAQKKAAANPVTPVISIGQCI